MDLFEKKKKKSYLKMEKTKIKVSKIGKWGKNIKEKMDLVEKKHYLKTKIKVLEIRKQGKNLEEKLKSLWKQIIFSNLHASFSLTKFIN